MSWTILSALFLGLLFAYLALLLRRAELERMGRAIAERKLAKSAGTHVARLQHPQIDLSRCLGCSACITACPEDGVLELIHGQAAVVHGANCVGHGHCQSACPTAAIVVDLSDVEERSDLPALTRSLQAVGVPGLFMPGEITGYSLIRSAIEQGRSVARAALETSKGIDPAPGEDQRGCDLLIVGAGPAGLACAVEAQERGLSVQVIEQGAFGGTVAQFPRQKLVITQPVFLPGWGELDQEVYTREELLAIWKEIAEEQDLEVHSGVTFLGLERQANDRWLVATSSGEWNAGSVCLALGRRGSPARLGIPGEDLAKVKYSMYDARAYQDRHILVVGGGDSAVEIALALSLQEGNVITLSYRKEQIVRPCRRNREALEEAVLQGRLGLELSTDLKNIGAQEVTLQRSTEEDRGEFCLTNDDVFIAIGGTTPIEMLQRLGVSFDPKDREISGRSLGSHVPHVERKRLLISVSAALSAAALTLGWALVNLDYYRLELPERPLSAGYKLLRPAGYVGIGLGIAAALMIALNLAYLLRRLPWIPLRSGKLRHWMTVHIVTGILALLLAFLHGGMHIGDTLGGHATLSLCFLIFTGAVGRYLYSFVPRASNGRDLIHDEVQEELRRLSGELDELSGDLADSIRSALAQEEAEALWKGGYLRKFWSLITARSRAKRALQRIESEARAADRDEEQIQEILMLVVRAQHSSQSASHFEELRGMLASWRHFHRWMALLLVLIVSAHIWDALRYGNIFD